MPTIENKQSDAVKNWPQPEMTQRHDRLPLAVAIVLIAFNLRPALSGFAPVVKEVMADTGLSAAGASVMSTAPVICLGVFAAVAPWLVRQVGLERAALLALATLAIGTAMRGFGNVITLIVGSLAAGAGIGVINVLLPGLLKRDFADKAPLMTGIYSMALCLGAAIGAGATAPLRDATGGSWRLALALWSVPALLAFGVAAWVWSGRLGCPTSQPGRALGGRLWRDPLAWQVTLYMGLQSMLAYSVFGWMAPILRDRGDSPTTAGLVVSISVLAQVGFTLPAPILAARMRSQSTTAAVMVLCSAGGILGLLVGPLWMQWGFAVLLGLGMGGAFSLAVLMMVLRAPNGMVAGRLSSMAQSCGYLIASTGPLLIGLAHDATGDWRGATVLVATAGVTAAVAGWLAGRNRFVKG